MLKENSDKKASFKKEIILKARDIIAKMGFKKSSIEEIAKTLDRTKGALYHYFANKEDIMKAVLKYEGSKLISALINAINIEETSDQKLRIFFLTRAKKIYDLWSFYHFVIDEYYIRYSFISNALTEYNDQELATVKNLIQEGIDQNIFTVSDITLSSKVLIKSMRGYDFFMFQGESFADIEDEINETLRILIKGIS